MNCRRICCYLKVSEGAAKAVHKLSGLVLRHHRPLLEVGTRAEDTWAAGIRHSSQQASKHR